MAKGHSVISYEQVLMQEYQFKAWLNDILTSRPPRSMIESVFVVLLIIIGIWFLYRQIPLVSELRFRQETDEDHVVEEEEEEQQQAVDSLRSRRTYQSGSIRSGSIPIPVTSLSRSRHSQDSIDSNISDDSHPHAE
eukprot:m.53244 g.53244  ORF g.53244 m.53244 type:complete len:136 (-) comp18372_c1_seq1:31-438(-)